MFPTLVALLLAAPAHPVKVAVLEFESGLGADPKLAHLVSGLVTAELRKRAELQVTSQQELQTLLGFEKQRQLLNCAQTSCMAEIGGALGVDNLVTGTVAQLGESLLLAVRFIDVRKAHVVREANRRLKNAEADAVLDVLPGLVAELMGESVPAAVAVPEPPAEVLPILPAPRIHKSATPLWLAVAGGAVAIAGGVVAGVEFGTAAQPNASGQYPISASGAATANAVGYAGQAAIGVGAAAALVGLGWYLFEPREVDP